MHHKKLSLFVLCLFAAMVGSPCHAGLSGHGSIWAWSNVSDNGQYVFVCLQPEPMKDQIALINECEENPPHFTRATERAEVQRLHKTYACTGMYLNNGSTKPIWTTSEEVYGGTPTSDGRYLVDFYDDGYGLNLLVVEPSRPSRSLREIDLFGWTTFFLYHASSRDRPSLDSYGIDPTSQHVLVTWDNQTTTTICLDDFAIVQSNVLPHAFFQLFTTMRGIVVFLVFVLITCGVSYALARCFMGGSKGSEARR